MPGPFGQAAAIDSAAGVAAPLLAGLTFALIVLLLQSDSGFRWRDAALAFLMSAALLLITAVQFAFSARRFYVPPAEWEEWKKLAAEGREQHLELQVAFYLDRHSSWLARTRYAYNLGIMALFFAVAISLVPPGPIGKAPVWRLVAIALALLGLASEAGWTLSGELSKWQVRRRRRRKTDGSRQ